MFQDARRYLPTNLAAANLDSARAFAERGRARLEEGRLLAAARLAEGKDLAAAQLAYGKDISAARLAEAKGLAAAQLQKGRDLAHLSAAQLAEIDLGVRLQDVRFEPPDTSTLALVGTTFNLLNATTGPGLLAVPLAFARCGWLVGSLLLVGVFALNNASLAFLLRACLTTREHSYIGLCLRAGGAIAPLVDWASLLFFFGSCVSYLVIIGDTFNLVTERFGTGPFYAGGTAMHFSGLALLLLIGFTALCLAPLSMLRSMDSLQPNSIFGMLCVLYAVAIVAITPADGPPPADAPVVAASLSADSLLSLPTMTFCFSSQSLFPPALESLHQPATYAHMTTVVDSTMYITLALHLAVGFGGYLRYGGATPANVLDALPQSAPVAVARVAVVFAFAFTYPMMIFLCRMHIQSILARARVRAQLTDAPGPAPPAEDHHVLVSLLLVGSSLVTAIIFPDIDAIFGLLGGTTSVVISFVAPAVFWERCVGYMYKWSHPNRLFCRALMVFSVVIAGLSLPGLLVSMVGDLYATAWWVPIASSSGMQSWSGGISLEAMADTVVSGEVVTTYDALRAVPPPPPPALHGHVERKKTRSVLGGFQQAQKQPPGFGTTWKKVEAPRTNRSGGSVVARRVPPLRPPARTEGLVVTR